MKNKDRITALEMFLKSESIEELSKEEVVEAVKKILHCCPSENAMRLFKNVESKINEMRGAEHGH